MNMNLMSRTESVPSPQTMMMVMCMCDILSKNRDVWQSGAL